MQYESFELSEPVPSSLLTSNDALYSTAHGTASLPSSPTTSTVRLHQPWRLLAKTTGWLAVGARAIWRDNKILVLACSAAAILGATFLVVVIGPRYADPMTRLYSTKFGYGTITRKLGRPFPVSCGTATKRTMVSRLNGEGLCSTEPVQVPIIAMSRILKIHARVGDHVTKGQLLVELDSRRAEVKLGAAEGAVKTALAEQERTTIGSAYILANERPDLQKIKLQTAQKMTRIQEQLVEMERSLHTSGASSKRDVLLSQVELNSALNSLRLEEIANKVAEAGRKESIQIANIAVEDAKLALKYRTLELEDYRVYAPCDGIVERCVIHEGEYNQDPGKPAFLLDQGIWFEARMDQITSGKVAIGSRATIYLESFPNRPLTGHVYQIVPVVSYDSGGPEATRPIRPLGSGAPEWPSTYAVRIKIDTTALPLMPGLTGFCRIDLEHEAIAIPLEAAFARSGKSALAYVVEGDHYRTTKITIGVSADGWMEVLAGLEPGAVVLTEGHQVLEPGDKVVEKFRDGQSMDPPNVLKDSDKSIARK